MQKYAILINDGSGEPVEVVFGRAKHPLNAARNALRREFSYDADCDPFIIPLVEVAPVAPDVANADWLIDADAYDRPADAVVIQYSVKVDPSRKNIDVEWYDRWDRVVS